MDWQYNYLLTDFLNNRVDVNRLHKEIQLVLSDLIYVNVENTCDIFFTRELTDTEENIILANIIAAHSGNPLSIISGLCELVDNVGDQELNNIDPVPIIWGQEDNIDIDFFEHIDSKIIAKESGYYEISYNINSKHFSNSRSITGIQVKLNDTSFIEKTLTASYTRNKSNNDNNNTLSPCLLLLNKDDYIEICGLRLGDNTSTLTKKGSSFVRIKYLGE